MPVKNSDQQFINPQMGRFNSTQWRLFGKSFEQVEFYEEAIVISTLTGVFQKWNSPLNRGIFLFREPRSPIPDPQSRPG
jgi:hypothetical protein